MKRQRNLSQMKDKTPEKKLHETETNNLPGTEFKSLVIKMLNEIRGKMD